MKTSLEESNKEITQQYKLFIKNQIMKINRAEKYDPATNESYINIVYISHPYGGSDENKREIEGIIRDLCDRYSDVLFISPVNAFEFLYDYIDYDDGLKACFWLLQQCDEMWVYGDYESSEGCRSEIKYCESNGIPYTIMRNIGEDAYVNRLGVNDCFEDYGSGYSDRYLYDSPTDNTED